MNRIQFAFILILAAMIPQSAVAQSKVSASAILSSLRAKMASAPAVEAVFTINGGSGPVQGSVIISGSKYTMTTPQMSVWYDGRTQWTMLENTREVSVTEPDAAELMAVNPFAILSDHQQHYTARRLADSSGRYRVELVPRDKNSVIKRYIIFVNQTTGWPSALTVDFDDDRRIEVVIESIAASKAKASSTFVFDKKKYPAAEIIDLR